VYLKNIKSDTLAGRVVQLETALTTAQDSIEREQKSAELARIELATANVRAEQQAKTEAAQQTQLQKLHGDVDELSKLTKPSAKRTGAKPS